MSVSRVADRLVCEEVSRLRAKRPVAVASVARAAGLAPGTLANLMRGRLKNTDRAAAALNTLLVSSIERKISELENELAVLRATGADARDPDVVGAEIALSTARACIERAKQ